MEGHEGRAAGGVSGTGKGVSIEPEESPERVLAQLCAPGVYRGRILLVCAHPDDETIGAGARLTHWPETWVAHVTEGAPAKPHYCFSAGCATALDYARRRRDELRAALELVGVPESRQIQLGYEDQKVSLGLAEVTQTIFEWLVHLGPDVVVTHPYEGGHPDHDATAFCARAAVDLLAASRAPRPVLVEMTSYFNRGGRLLSGEFLPGSTGPEAVAALTKRERELKERMYACFATQKAPLRYIPPADERFRIAPAYDFREPPHQGTLFYEMFDWGMSGSRWRSLATLAVVQLGLGGPALPYSEPGHVASS